jgi:hypothetical protein
MELTWAGHMHMNKWIDFKVSLMNFDFLFIWFLAYDDIDYQFRMQFGESFCAAKYIREKKVQNWSTQLE